MKKGVILPVLSSIKQLCSLVGACARRIPESIKAEGEGKEDIKSDRDSIERTIHERVRAIIEQMVEAELDAALGAKGKGLWPAPAIENCS